MSQQMTDRRRQGLTEQMKHFLSSSGHVWAAAVICYSNIQPRIFLTSIKKTIGP